jgi:tetratricopeptide (TPR) repeat protein
MVMRSMAAGALAVLLAGAALARTALAARPDARVAEARKACAAGEVERGVQLLAELIAERNDPNAVYNQARCYQANGQPEPALSRFKEYLRVAPGLSARERRQVKQHMRELEQELDARARRAALAASEPQSPQGQPTNTSPSTAPPSAAGASTPSPKPASTPSPAVVNLTDPPPPAPTANRPLLVLSALTAAAGVTALAGGAFYSLETRRIEQQIERQSLPIASEMYQRRTREGQRAQSRQWLGYGAGAAALGTSAVLYLLGHGRF